jgi:hypothetical protein
MSSGEGRETGHYDRTYELVADELYATIRRETFGEEIGQFSWLTADEYRRFFALLGIDARSDVLEVASGSGGPAIFMAQETGCRVTGLDIHQAGSTRPTRGPRSSVSPTVPGSCARTRESHFRSPTPRSTLSPASTPSIICTSESGSSASGIASFGPAPVCSSPTRSS